MKSEWDKGMKLTWGDIISLEYGKPVPDKFQTNGDVPVFGTNGQIGTSNLPPLCSHASTIVGRKGAYRGVHYSNVPFSVIDTAFFVEETTKLTDSKWIYYKLLTLDINRMDSGSAIPSTDRSEIYSLPVTVPPLPTQRKIASILSALDDKIETNNAICRNLEEQSMALYKSWFVNFEPFQNQDFINTAIGIIPSDWTVGKLGSIANIVTGKRPKRKTADKNGHDNVPILGASGIMGYTNESMYRSKILVIGRVGTLGVVQRVEKDCWPSDNALVIQSPYYEYVKQVLVRFDYLSINRGSTQPLITQTDIKNICVIIPPQHILKQFEYRVGKCMNLYSLLLDETKKLEEMREALLPKLMSGELTV